MILIPVPQLELMVGIVWEGKRDAAVGMRWDSQCRGGFVEMGSLGAVRAWPDGSDTGNGNGPASDAGRGTTSAPIRHGLSFFSWSIPVVVAPPDGASTDGSSAMLHATTSCGAPRARDQILHRNRPVYFFFDSLDGRSNAIRMNSPCKGALLSFSHFGCGDDF